jgi:hypothetical protein
MIYSAYGCELTIIAYCGKHKPPWAVAPLILIQARRIDDDTIRHYWMHTLKATDGINEIEKTVGAVPEIVMTPQELKTALAEAD